MASSPTSRTLDRLRADGWLVAVVDQGTQVNPEILTLPLTKGMVCVVDAGSMALNGGKWVASFSGRAWYAVRGRGTSRQYMHRIVAGALKGQFVDHINGNTLDNRASNLRICTQQQNTWNGKGRNGSSGYKGVARHKDKFCARLTFGGKNLYLGIFDRAKDAALAYDVAAKQYFGEFARCNFG